MERAPVSACHTPFSKLRACHGAVWSHAGGLPLCHLPGWAGPSHPEHWREKEASASFSSVCGSAEPGPGPGEDPGRRPPGPRAGLLGRGQGSWCRFTQHGPPNSQEVLLRRGLTAQHQSRRPGTEMSGDSPGSPAVRWHLELGCSGAGCPLRLGGSSRHPAGPAGHGLRLSLWRRGGGCVQCPGWGLRVAPLSGSPTPLGHI